MDYSKVVPLKPRAEATQDESSRRAILSLPLEKLQGRAQGDLAELLKHMFDHADDALFELADKAMSNGEQNLYFEAMREIRIQRRGIEKRFGEQISNCFICLDKGSVQQSNVPVSDSELSLLGREEMEEQVAIDSMANKNSAPYTQQVAMLSARMDAVLKVDVCAKNNPLSVRNICDAFMLSCQALDIGIKAKLVFFKLFERYVLAQLMPVYQSLNEMLAADGILPGLTPEALRQNREQRSVITNSPLQSGQVSDNGSLRGQPLGTVSSMNQQSYQEADALLSELGALMASGGRMVSADPNSGLQPVGQAATLPRSTMMSLLGSLQQQQSSEFQQVAPQGVAGQMNWQSDPDAVIRLLNTKVQQHFDTPQSLGKVEDDVVNLVQMLFQFILDDRNLAEPMKALIARLQIPMLKVALLDRSFFSKGGHPARKLLNAVATSALGWMPPAEGKKDPLFEKVSSIVQQLLHDFSDDISVFQQLHEDFQTFIDLEKRRSKLIEQRIVDAEDGKARSESAREQVQRCIDERIDGLVLPQVALDIIDQAWKNYLLLVLLKDTDESANWQQALGDLDALLWSLRMPDAFASPDELLKAVPGLLKALRGGMNKLGLNPFDVNKMFAELEAEHLKRIKAMRTHTSLNNEDQVKVEVKHAAEEGQLAAEIPASLLRQIDAIATGTWVEFVEDERHLRCRLAARIKHTGTLIFVNRNGQKVAEHKTPEIAEKIQLGTMTILNDGLLFDRALESVISNLREKK